MPTTLILLAHPEPRSFTAQWARATADAAEAAGHAVLWSDLYGQGFAASEGPRHYRPAPAPFDPLKAQEDAAAQGRLPADVATEIAKIRAADRLILHFPLWWFAPPAILKGWCDRVLAHGALHTVDQRFDTGLCRGKRALFCVTTGATAAEAGPGGKEGDTRLLLWPLAYTLRYLGMTVLSPVLLHGVHGYHRGEAAAALRSRLWRALADQPDLIARFDSLPELSFNAETDFDAEGRLRPTAPSHSPFIRHPGRAGA